MNKEIRKYLLIRDHKTDPPAACFAIAELSRVMKMCGLPMLGHGKGFDVLGMADESDARYISIGDTPLFREYGLTADKNNIGGGYNIKTIDGNVFIYAPENEGLINGTYRFMQEVFGYRFYAMDEEKVDIRDEYYVPDLDISERPHFLGRRIDHYDLYRDPVYSARLRQNSSCGLVENPYNNAEGTRWAVLDDQSLAFQLVPHGKYFTDEYKAKGWWSEKGMQLCWTKALYDEELFELICHNLIEAVKAQPDKLFYMIGQTDNREYCHCPTCERDYAKYGTSGVFLRMVNKLADRVKEFIDREQGGREHYLCMFAYIQTEVPPVKVENGEITPIDDSVIARDNVMIRFAPINSGVNYSLLDAHHNPQSTSGFIGWKVIAKHFAIWDYGTDFGGYIAPYPDWDVMEKSLRFYHDELDAVDILTQLPAHTSGTAFWQMKMFMRAHLMWDTHLSARALMNEFIDAYYGLAAEEMREYIALLDRHYAQLRANSAYAGYIWEQLYIGVTFDKKTVKAIKRIFDRAFNKAKKESVSRRPVIEKRLRSESLFYRYVMLTAYIHEMDYDELVPFYTQFKKDAREATCVAFKNGWRWNGGKMDNFYRDVEQRIGRLKLAKQYSNADNNPFKGSKYAKK